MKYAVIENGNVINIIELDDSEMLPGTELEIIPEGEVVDIGYKWVGTTFEPPPKPDLTDTERLELITIQRDERISAALNYVSFNNLNAKLLLNMLSDEEKNLYASIIKYVDTLRGMQFNSLSEIKWPALPY
ncbi:tail fiber assembly protein [Escherichia coli]|uniref:tail fiber assembly protein n=1 Tax=Escherichia coli TaxID=562 RepID=UPI0003353EC4|nr:tail fiber assembly protein [Escherichia coli]EOV64600.1 hypothetical protein A1U1_00675 [Escherichia coli KTE64]